MVAAWGLAGVASGQETPKHTTRAPAEAKGAPTRPPAADLRAGLEDILQRREYRQALAEDPVAELQRRILNRLAQVLARLFEPLGALQETNRTVFYVLVVGLTLLLLAVVAHIVLTIRAGLRATRQVRPGESRRRQPGETDPQRLRRRAGQLAAAGDFLGALRTVYIALIRHLDRAELLRYDPTRTNWEYAAQVRHLPEATAILRPFGALLDRTCYGGEPATEADYQAGVQWLEEALRLGEVAS